MATGGSNMKLFITKTSKDWSYCAGGAAVIAERLEDVWPMLNAEYNRDNTSEHTFVLEPLYENEDVIPLMPFSRHKVDAFVFVEAFDVPPQPARVVMFDFHTG
jgi:hypothetical protein